MASDHLQGTTHLRLVAEPAKFATLDLDEQAIVLDLLDPSVNLLPLYQVGKA
jgi:hypothetical protein